MRDRDLRALELLAEARAIEEPAPHPAIEARLLRAIEARSRSKPSRWRMAVLPLAAVLLAVLASLLLPRSGGITVSQGNARIGDRVIAAGDRFELGATIGAQSVTLFTAGQTLIELQPGASLTVHAIERLELSLGTARFWAQAKAAPIVVAGPISIDAFLARFSVSRDGNVVRVFVEEGSIGIAQASGRVVVSAGQTWPPQQIKPVIVPPVTIAPPQPVNVAPIVKRSAPIDPPTLARAAAQVRGGAFMEARETYRSIAASDAPAASTALFLLAELEHQRLGSSEAALLDLDELSKRFGDHALSREALLLKMQILLRLERCSAAEAAIMTLAQRERPYLDRLPADLRTACDGAIERIVKSDH